MEPRFRLTLLAALFSVLLSLPVHAQDYQDDDDGNDDPAAAKLASLSLQINKTGTMHFFLSSGSPFSAPTEVRAFFTGRWSCSIDDASPASREDLARLPQAERDQVEAEWKELAAKSMSGTCSGPLRKDLLSVTGDFDVQPLMNLLRQDGIENLRLTFTLPNFGSNTVLSPPGKTSTFTVKTPYRAWWYTLPVSEPAHHVHVSFGYSRAELIRLGAYTSLYLIIPVFIVLIMRSAALRRGANDPAGAWFSFMRTSQLCMTAAMLLWGTTPINPRSQLVDVASFAGWNDAWRAVCAHLIVTVVPIWSIYLLGTALSYKVFVRIRNVSWTWTQFMTRQMVQMGRAFIPLTLTLAGILTMIRNFRAGAALVGLAWLSAIVLGQLHLKLEKNRPAAITSGPLRDRIFALAQTLGVKVQQVFVVPAAQTSMANAFATNNQTVLFTDYLIEKLSRREVDAVAAHELTHLRHSHAQKLSFMVLGAILLPGFVLALAGGALHGFLFFAPVSPTVRNGVTDAFLSGWMQGIAMIVCFGILYFIQKKFEYTADAGAVFATRDPEALITALVKISRLNLMPLQWGRGSEAMMTHPSTMRRLQRIARSRGMSDEHLSSLIAESEKAPQPSEGYDISTGTQGVVKATKSPRKLFFLIAMHILPPAAIALSLQKFFPHASSTWWALAAGAVASVASYHLGVRWLGWTTNRHRTKEARNTLAEKTGPFRPEQGIPVGFAPTGSPRFFATGYNWDHGLLFLSAEKLVFVGSHCTLALKRDQIRTIVLGKGAPSWSNWHRVYFAWEDRETGRSGCFNLLPLEQKSLLRPDSRSLYMRLRNWRNRQGDTGEAIAANEFGPPTFAEVTSKSPKEINKLSRTLGLNMIIMALAAGLSLVLKLESAWYLISIVLLIRLYEQIPYWRYREQPVVFDAPSASLLVRPPAGSGAAPPPPPPPGVAPPPPVESGPVTVP
jgi:Zn-dependent protease with chaperone function